VESIFFLKRGAVVLIFSREEVMIDIAVNGSIKQAGIHQQMLGQARLVRTSGFQLCFVRLYRLSPWLVICWVLERVRLALG